MLLFVCKKDYDGPMNVVPTIEAQTFSVAENAAVDAAVGTVTASDAQNDELMFSIASGKTNNVLLLIRVGRLRRRERWITKRRQPTP